jgi:hypothetical protein
VFTTEIRRFRKALDTIIAAFKTLGVREIQFDPLKLEFVHDKHVSSLSDKAFSDYVLFTNRFALFFIHKKTRFPRGFKRERGGLSAHADFEQMMIRKLLSEPKDGPVAGFASSNGVI